MYLASADAFSSLMKSGVNQTIFLVVKICALLICLIGIVSFFRFIYFSQEPDTNKNSMAKAMTKVIISTTCLVGLMLISLVYASVFQVPIEQVIGFNPANLAAGVNDWLSTALSGGTVTNILLLWILFSIREK